MMKAKIFLIFFILCYFGRLYAQNQTNVCVSVFEKALYNKLMEYRKQKNLPVIPLSKSLTIVARTHVKDLIDNHPDIEDCNMHSWSSNGKWTACCYTDDHKKAQCMWDKPKELTGYPSYGYEIAYNTSPPSENPEKFASDALDAWENSSGHISVILNKSPWSHYSWQAIGIGIYNGYAVVWFGTLKDPQGEPSMCNSK